MKPRILLTNDDGIASPGIVAAARALLSLGEVLVVAPSRQQTSMGRAYTGAPEARFEPASFTVDGVSVQAYACDASPAAVVRHALLVFPDFAPSLVVAGINYGENVGVCVTGSGTVGATLDAACKGIPSLAMSLETDIRSHREYSGQNWDAAEHFTRYFAQGLLRKGMPAGVDILKVEVPDTATKQTPWQITRLSPHLYYTLRLQRPGLEAELKDGVIGKRACDDEPHDTDAYAIRKAKAVSVTPLVVDLTARTPFDEVRSWLENA